MLLAETFSTRRVDEVLAAARPDTAACTSAPPGVADGNYTSSDPECTGASDAPLGKQW